MPENDGEKQQKPRNDDITEQIISTSAISGLISTPGFGKPFDNSVFTNPKSSHTFIVNINISGINVPEGEDVSISLNIDWNLHKKEKITLCGDDERIVPKIIEFQIIKCFDREGNCIKRENPCHDPHCHNNSNIELRLTRESFDENEINVAKLQPMTGMKVAWKYSENIKSSKPLYKNEKFKEMADMFNQYGSQIDFWPKIKSFTVASFMAKNG